MYTAEDHANNVASFRQNSVPVVFSAMVPELDTLGNATGNMTTRSVLIHCMDNYVNGDPLEYDRLGLSPSSAPALFGMPDVFGEEPDAMMRCVWALKPGTLRSVKPFRPQGKTATIILIVEQ
jgi:hypothetical protein